VPAHKLRCAEDEHRLTVTPGTDGLVVIDAPDCTVDCFCCQRAGSLGHAVPSLFKPGVLSAHRAD
jgi:hypothetical protein